MGWSGKGKAAEVPAAISKAVEQAKKHLVRIPVLEGTIPHEVLGKFGSESIILKPAVEGTGIIAGVPCGSSSSLQVSIISLPKLWGEAIRLMRCVPR